MSKQLRAPFPYFGGKSKVAALIWERLGNVSHYIEPFAGSLAVMLARPHALGPTDRRLTETVNDADGLLCNFWRSMALKPDETIGHALGPVFELDLHARHAALIEARESITERLRVDPKWCDPEVAGWWVWGCGATIGDVWHRAAPQRACAAIGDTGRGVRAFSGPERIRECAARVKDARVLCGDWRRAVATSACEKWGGSTVGVFLDPPYGEGKVSYAEGGNQTHDIVRDVWEWAERMQEHAHVRMAIAGYDGHPCLPGWREVSWKASGGYGSLANGDARKNSSRERLWFSPSCLTPASASDEGACPPPHQQSLMEAAS